MDSTGFWCFAHLHTRVPHILMTRKGYISTPETRTPWTLPLTLKTIMSTSGGVQFGKCSLREVFTSGRCAAAPLIAGVHLGKCSLREVFTSGRCAAAPLIAVRLQPILVQLYILKICILVNPNSAYTSVFICLFIALVIVTGLLHL